jgi:hypothetical protein
MTMADPQEHFNAARRFQEYYDRTLSKVGTSAPAPKLGQSVNDYRRETMRQLKRVFLPQNHDLYRVQYRDLRADALDAIEPQLLKTVEVEAVNPANFAPGELRLVPKIDQQTGLKTNNWYGQESFVRLPNFGCETQALGGYRPGRRVVSFTTDRGRYDAIKARWF